jgi:hypothetical protein
MRTWSRRPTTRGRSSQEALAGLQASVERFGLVEPVVWNRRTGRVVGGHQRLKVLQQMGGETTEGVVVDLPEIEEKALNVALNNPAIAGEFTADIHHCWPRSTRRCRMLSDDLRFDDLEMTNQGAPGSLTPTAGHDGPRRRARGPGRADHPTRRPVDPRGPPARVRRQRRSATLDLVMDGQVAKLYATDPPYGVGYDGTAHPQNQRDKAGRT